MACGCRTVRQGLRSGAWGGVRVIWRVVVRGRVNPCAPRVATARCLHWHTGACWGYEGHCEAPVRYVEASVHACFAVRGAAGAPAVTVLPRVHRPTNMCLDSHL